MIIHFSFKNTFNKLWFCIKTQSIQSPFRLFQCINLKTFIDMHWFSLGKNSFYCKRHKIYSYSNIILFFVMVLCLVLIPLLRNVVHSTWNRFLLIHKKYIQLKYCDEPLSMLNNYSYIIFFEYLFIKHLSIVMH